MRANAICETEHDQADSKPLDTADAPVADALGLDLPEDDEGERASNPSMDLGSELAKLRPRTLVGMRAKAANVGSRPPNSPIG